MSKSDEQVQGTRNTLCKGHAAKGEFIRIGCWAGFSPQTCKSCGENGDNRICPPKDAKHPMWGECDQCNPSPSAAYADIEREQKKKKKEKSKEKGERKSYRPTPGGARF